jgi:hypothetical protein
MHETAGLPRICNVTADTREKRNVGAENGWLAPYLQLIEECKASLRDHSNPIAANLADF